MNKRKLSGKSALVVIGMVLVLGILLFIVLLNLWGGTKQPIAFNHKIHAENELACLDCHILFEEHASAGKPGLDLCAGCHEEPLSESKEQAEIVELVQKGEEIPWQRLYRVPEDVYFSHRRHVVSGELECGVCHGDIGESLKPPRKPKKITMRRCMNCHEETQADNDCIACHR